MRSRRKCQLFWWNFLRLKNRVWENICVQVLIAILDLLVTATNPDSHPLPHTSDSPQYWFPPHDQTSPSYSLPPPHTAPSSVISTITKNARPTHPDPPQTAQSSLSYRPHLSVVHTNIPLGSHCNALFGSIFFYEDLPKDNFPVILLYRPALYGIIVLHGSELHWYCRSDPEWLEWHWWWDDWNLKKCGCLGIHIMYML